MAGRFSYLELMASLDPPDPSSWSRFGCQPQAIVEDLNNGFPDAASNFETLRLPTGQPNYLPDFGINYNHDIMDTTDEEDRVSPTPGCLPKAVPLCTDHIVPERSPSVDYDENMQDDDVLSPDNINFNSHHYQYQDSSDDDQDHSNHFSSLLCRDDSSDEDVPIISPGPQSEINPEPSHIEANLAPTPPLYKTRRRHKKGAKLPSSRQSTVMGPIEIALRGSSTRKTEYIFQPVVGTCFDSAAEAYDFYNLYSWEKGFGISYGRSDTNRGNQYRTMQELQCASQGIDRRCVHQSQRCGCKAVVKLLRTEDHGWYISKFEEEHNHPFSDSYGEKMQWGSHRRIDECAKNIIKHLRENNVPLGKVHSIMGSVYGSVEDLPFTKRSLRTLCQQLAREQMDDDVKKTLDIFRKMRKEDPDFAYSVEVDKHNRIKTLIWTNHRSKMQYQCFGDVFTFDTTYCTNNGLFSAPMSRLPNNLYPRTYHCSWSSTLLVSLLLTVHSEALVH